ncbi:MAG: hypothetical protein ACFFCZ_25065 [Promethearchaeota archaeon]
MNCVLGKQKSGVKPRLTNIHRQALHQWIFESPGKYGYPQTT